MDIRETLKEQAVQIGDEILMTTKKNSHGWYWETLSLDEWHNPYWDVNESLYSGAGGIVLFFLELYKKTNRKEYLEAMVEGAKWLIWYCRENPTDNYAFFTGRIGISYLMLKCYELTEDKYYLHIALDIAENCDSFLESHVVNDLINGISGTLLGLLHLHSFTGKDWVLRKISLFVEHLLNTAKIGQLGIYWDLNRGHTQPLCGFSHGTSGIGYVFLELGHYFNNKAFYFLTEQAFAYENFHFDEDHRNWPDFRNILYNKESYENYKKAYLEDDIDFFKKPSFMMAWCHGAPGIGLSRIRALQILGDEKYKTDVRRAIQLTYHSMKDFRKRATYTLCHGRGGNALLYVDAYHKLGNKKFMELAHEIARQAIKSHRDLSRYISGYSNAEKQEDLSLFMGKAGVGYFYLKCLKETDNSLVLAPNFDKQISTDYSYSVLNLSKHDVKLRVLKNVYPRLIDIIELEFPNSLEELLESDDIKSNFGKAIDKLCDRINESMASRIRDIFNLEKIKLEEKITINPTYIFIQDDLQYHAAQRIIELGDSEILKQEIKLNDTVSFKKTKWIWDLENPDQWILNIKKEAKVYHVMFIKRVNKIEEFSDLSDFARLVFESFAVPQKVEKMILNFAQKTGTEKKIYNLSFLNK